MELFDKVVGYCEIRGAEVEIVLVKMKGGRRKTATPLPLRCQGAAQCAKGSFCRFVNPLTTRLPVDIQAALGKNAS